MKRFILKISFCLVAIAALAACKSEDKLLSRSGGQPGEIIVVADPQIWNGQVGETLRNILTEPDTLLPQPEAKFSLINIQHDHFSRLFRVHRNIVIVQIEKDRETCEISTKKDVYSKPQTIVYILGSDIQQIVDELKKRANPILDIFEQSDLNNYISSNKTFENAELRRLVENKYGYSMYFPREYELFGDKNEFMWIGIRTTERTQGVLIYSYPYENEKQLTRNALIEKRNEVLKKYVLLDKEPQGSAYMTTATYIEPSYRTTKINDEFFAIIRGLWEVENDFMGGPFVSYTTVDNKNNKIISFDGFVYAPSKTKRNLLQQTEGVILTQHPFNNNGK